MSRAARVFLLVALTVAGAGQAPRAADRQVAWVVISGDRSTERELNTHASRGLRLATVSDGLPCSVAVMQTPRTEAVGDAAYRVLADRDLAPALAGLAAEGFVPRGMLRRPVGRAHVVWERTAATQKDRMAAWRLVEFANPDTLEQDLAAVVQEGFRAVTLARGAFKSWPGLSEKGLMIVGQRAGAVPRSVRVVRGTKRDTDDLAREVAALSADGWELDVTFTSSRDGNRETRRERAFLVFSRPTSGRGAATPLRLERSSAWGMIGSGEVVAAANYWHDFLFIWRPVERRQIWASPIRLSAAEAGCVNLSLKLAVAGEREQRSDIVGAVAREVPGMDAWEFVVVLDERFGR
jgi:hypothetical protein